MMIVEKELYCQRGESFTLGFVLIKNYQGIEFPYFTQMGIDNPHFLLQVRNSEFYEKNKGSIYNYWIPMNTIYSEELKFDNYLPLVNKKPMLSSDENDWKNFKNGSLYYKCENGIYTFYIKTGDETNVKFEGKTFFKHTFLPIDIENFRQGTWWYEIKLVSGQTTTQFLRGKYESLFPTEESWSIHDKNNYTKYGNSPKWLYDKLCEKRNKII